MDRVLVVPMICRLEVPVEVIANQESWLDLRLIVLLRVNTYRVFHREWSPNDSEIRAFLTFSDMFLVSTEPNKLLICIQNSAK